MGMRCRESKRDTHANSNRSNSVKAAPEEQEEKQLHGIASTEAEKEIFANLLGDLLISIPINVRKTSFSAIMKGTTTAALPQKGRSSNGTSGGSCNPSYNSNTGSSLGNRHGVRLSCPPIPARKKRRSSSMPSSKQHMKKVQQLPSDQESHRGGVFHGVFINQILLCRSEYNSKHNTTAGRQVLFRWRKVKIIAIEGADNSRVKVQSIDIAADEYTKWVDLRREWFKLAPVGLLSQTECLNGDHLSDSQKDVVTRFLRKQQQQQQQQQQQCGHSCDEAKKR